MEAGATVKFNAVAATDKRASEVLASGLPLRHGAQLAVDITFDKRSDLLRECVPAGRSGGRCGVARARPDKERKSAQLLQGDRCHWVVVAIETGGRWSTESLDLVRTLASARARDAPPILRRLAYLAWIQRWSRMLVVSCGRAFALSMVSPPAFELQGTDGPPPDLVDLSLD